MISGEYTISCRKCNFEGRWMNTPTPSIYTPEKGCYKNAIHYGWCNSCNTITKQYSGKAGSYGPRDFGIHNEKKSFIGRVFLGIKHRKALKQIPRLQAEANQHFRHGQRPRCLECSSFEVKIGHDENIPHSCGESLNLRRLTRERGSFSAIEYSYYDNQGLVVRTEMKFFS